MDVHVNGIHSYGKINLFKPGYFVFVEVDLKRTSFNILNY